MSIRENIQFFHTIDIEKYLDTLRVEHGARKHPSQPDAYLIDGLPFYRLKQTEHYVFIMGFNMAPLSLKLIRTLVDHPELAPGDTSFCWTQEQDLIAEGTLTDFDKRKGDKGLG